MTTPPMNAIVSPQHGVLPGVACCTVYIDALDEELKGKVTAPTTAANNTEHPCRLFEPV